MSCKRDVMEEGLRYWDGWGHRGKDSMLGCRKDGCSDYWRFCTSLRTSSTAAISDDGSTLFPQYHLPHLSLEEERLQYCNDSYLHCLDLSIQPFAIYAIHVCICASPASQEVHKRKGPKKRNKMSSRRDTFFAPTKGVKRKREPESGEFQSRKKAIPAKGLPRNSNKTSFKKGTKKHLAHSSSSHFVLTFILWWLADRLTTTDLIDDEYAPYSRIEGRYRWTES